MRPVDLAAGSILKLSGNTMFGKSLSGWGQSYEIVGAVETNRIARRMRPTIDFNLGLSLIFFFADLCILYGLYGVIQTILLLG